MQVSNHKDGWVPEESLVHAYFEHRDAWSAIPQSGSLAVTRAALTGADLWRDRRLLDVVFFSDRLFQAMATAGIGKLDEFYPCRVVSGPTDGASIRAHDAKYILAQTAG